MNQESNTSNWIMCNKCSAWYQGLHVCAVTYPYQQPITTPQTTTHPIQQYGWICPKCNKGNAPWLPTCGSCPGSYTITCTSGINGDGI